MHIPDHTLWTLLIKSLMFKGETEPAEQET